MSASGAHVLVQIFWLSVHFSRTNAFGFFGHCQLYVNRVSVNVLYVIVCMERVCLLLAGIHGEKKCCFLSSLRSHHYKCIARNRTASTYAI